MEYLLDTHTLLWFLNSDQKLSPHAQNIIEEADVIQVSIASLWEIAIKHSIGKLALPDKFDNIFPYQLNKNNIEILPIDISHIQQINHLEFHHRDPFDRIIIAQSLVENMPLISKDNVFKQYNVKCVW